MIPIKDKYKVSLSTGYKAKNNFFSLENSFLGKYGSRGLNRNEKKAF